MRRVLSLLVVLAAAVPALGEEPTPAEVPVFPNLRLSALDGSSQLELHSLHGRPVLLTIWASWCGPCRIELPELEELSAELADDGFALVTINTDRSPASGIRFLKRHGIDVPVYRMDPRILRDLGIRGYPTNVLLGPDGRVAKAITGYSPDLPEMIRQYVKSLNDESAGQVEDSG